MIGESKHRKKNRAQKLEMAQISFLTSGIFTKFYEELKLIKFQLSIVICIWQVIR